jgi:hypothetical protein
MSAHAPGILLKDKACTSALLYGAQNRKSIIDDRMVKLVVECELS